VVQVLLGAGQAVVAPASYRWIRHHFVEQERGLAIALYMTGTKIGPAIGTPLAAWLIGIYDWRANVRADRAGRPDLAGALAPAGDQRRRQIERAAVKKDGTLPIPFGRIMASPVCGAPSSRRSATCTSSTFA